MGQVCLENVTWLLFGPQTGRAYGLNMGIGLEDGSLQGTDGDVSHKGSSGQDSWKWYSSGSTVMICGWIGCGTLKRGLKKDSQVLWP